MQDQNFEKGKILVSVIIPIYNAERYIKRCLNSVCLISRTDVEFILVNDGSTDSSLQICQEIQKKDKRIKIYCQSNRGVSSARNCGINLSKGEWVTFIDADDEINSSVYEFAIGSLNEKFQLLCMGSKSVQSMKAEMKLSSSTMDIASFNKSDIEVISDTLIEIDKKEYKKYKNFGIDFAVPWSKFYNKKLILNAHIYFRENLSIGEDRVFNYLYLKHIDNIQYTTSCGYYYYQIDSSAMNGYKEGKKDKLLASVEAFQQVAPEKKYEVAQYGIRLYLVALKLDFCHLDNIKSYKQRRKEALEFRRKEVIQNCFLHGNIFRLRLAAVPIAIMAKMYMFGACNLLLKMKAKLKLKL